ncbi:hypothetical protein BV20DRAFT_1069746 [Pilatotrama ljubarskyi]|nr:hypothetical protein BV20DRAFT_1069746 [Pilatotrama ljubarskyi]
MQEKLDAFERYCAANSLLINIPKTLSSIHGPLPDPLPSLTLQGRLLMYTAQVKYVGTSLTSTERDIFVPHYAAKKDAAIKAANACMSLASYVGPLPPSIALTLYRARVEPHLTSGCEVVLDVRPAGLASLVDVQTTYLRRALHVSPRSQLAPLFTDTGVWPLAYRRFSLALRYLRYILVDKPALVLDSFIALWQLTTLHGAPTWWSDLRNAGAALPAPVDVDLARFPTVEDVTRLLRAVEHALATHLRDAIMASRRLPLLQHRLRRILVDSEPGLPSLEALCTSQAYLSLPTHRLRQAITLLRLSEHPLAVERLRRATPPIPRELRLCRFCRQPWAVEDEVHVLLECNAPELMHRREALLATAERHHRSIRRLQVALSSAAFLDLLLSTEVLLQPFAGYVAEVFELCGTLPPLLPPDAAPAAGALP